MASLLEGLGCQGKESQSMTQTALLNHSHVFGMLRNQNCSGKVPERGSLHCTFP